MKTPEEIAQRVMFNVTGKKWAGNDLIANIVFKSALAAIEYDRRQIAQMLQDGADVWEADGDDEKLVNEVIDPFIFATLERN